MGEPKFFAGLNQWSREFIECLLQFRAKKEEYDKVIDPGSEVQPLHRYTLPSGEVYFEAPQAEPKICKGRCTHLAIKNSEGAWVIGSMWTSEEIEAFIQQIVKSVTPS